MANQLPKIKHVVQLMMENRSFDQMLGFLYADQKNVSPRGQPYEGLTGKESNPDGAGREVQVYKISKKSPHPYLMPGADPGEGFYNTNQQLFSLHDVPKGTVATNKGFVMSALGWLTVSLLGFPQLGALVGGVLAVLAFLPVSMWALYAALNKSHRSYAVVLVRPL